MPVLNVNFKFLSVFVLILIASSITLEAYSKPDYATKEEWKKVEPYLLPEDHPAKTVLDQIFSSSRAILSLETMDDAGFIKPMPRKWTHVIVCKHKDLEGYIIKTYVDAQRYFKNIPDYEHWLKRIHGIELINEVIIANNFENYFKSPRKWIYPLPENPYPSKEFVRKNYVLIEEDMDLLSDHECKEMWKSPVVTTEFLDAFYFLLEEVGLNDCAKPDNAPFTTDGRVAFIDTETNESWPVGYSKLTPYLSPEMKAYWKQLTKKRK